jgi:epidermal growth factor receptor substrate 15
MFFQRSALPNMILAQVWNLADTEQRSALSVSEFIIAMHLLASYRNGAITSLPTTLPAGLIEAASRRPTQAAAIPRQFSGQNAARTSSPLARQAYGPPPTAPIQPDWVIGPAERQGFDNLFNRLDTNNAGFISGVQAVEFFGQSELPQESLAAIWDLATIRGQDQLNKDEFAVAMFLIRDQRGKAKPDLPAHLPHNLIPPSLRGQVKPSIAPPPISTGFAPAPAQSQKPPSAAEDLFGLDALSASPTQAVQQQATGGSAGIPSKPFDDPFSNKSRSPTSPKFTPSPQATGASHFKPFVPSSSFGQGLHTQNTGGSGTSSQAPSQPQTRDFRPQASAFDDLLGDNDESSKKISNETSELANMSNQIGILRNQMQDVQNKKSVTEQDLASTNNQKRDLELRLSQFRTQYEQEARAVKELEEQLTTSRKETRRIQQDLALLEAGYQDLQTQHRTAAAALDNERRENASFKERMRHINAEVAQLKPQLEKLQNETRREKGLVSITKKQLGHSETERDNLRTEIDELNRSASDAAKVPLPEQASNVAGPAASTAGQKTNPFFRKSPQPSFDNSMSPGGFQQRSPAPATQSPSISNIFGPPFGGVPVTNPPTTSFRGEPFPSEPSVTSSEPGLPTPSASPHPSEAPAPPTSRQITSNDLPLPGARPDTAASSVRVETPTSRYAGAETPTNAGSASPAPGSVDRPAALRHDNQGSTGAAMFDRAASPVASINSDTSRGKQAAKPDFFGSFGNSVPGAFPDSTPLEANQTGGSAFSDRSKPSAPRSESFGFAARQDMNPKSDFDSAFASVGGLAKAVNRQTTGSSQGDGTGVPKSRFESEFPPIQTHEEEEDSDSDDGRHGFGDSFTQASPARHKNVKNEPKEAVGGSSFFGAQPPVSELPRPDAQKSPPSYNTAAGGRIGSQDFPSEFGGLLPSRENPLLSPSQEAQSPSVGTRGDALFGGSSTASKSASGAPTSTFSAFSGSPPPMTGTPASTTGTHSEAYHSAPTHPNTERDFSSSTQKSGVSGGGFNNDDFDSGFDDLAESKDDVGDEDDFIYGSQHHGQADDDWNPNFDSPAASKAGTMHSERTPTAGQSTTSKGFEDFNDFESSFNKPLGQPTLGVGGGNSAATGLGAAASGGGKPISDDWDDMFKNISGDGAGSKSGFGEHEPFGSHSTGAPPAAPMPPSSGSLSAPPAAPEAPEPPKLGRTITESSIHDVEDVKKLVKMGFPRPLVVNALEKYDYDFNKVC